MILVLPELVSLRRRPRGSRSARRALPRRAEQHGRQRGVPRAIAAGLAPDEAEFAHRDRGERHALKRGVGSVERQLRRNRA